jgi:hypothetical protein
MRTITAKVSDELYNLFQTRAAEQGKKVGTLLKNIISEYMCGSNAQMDRLSSSIEQMTRRVHMSHNEMDILCNKIIEVITGMHDFQLAADEKFSQRANRIQQAINFCAAHSEVTLQKEGGREAVGAVWKSINVKTGISQSQAKFEGDVSENES